MKLKVCGQARKSYKNDAILAQNLGEGEEQKKGHRPDVFSFWQLPGFDLGGLYITQKRVTILLNFSINLNKIGVGSGKMGGMVE